ncbi:DUF4494 domain-containing protein [Fulvivirga sediminis]|uniref:DUF4494 domain-containing protein n=1 Tax=Fulvivirga sediminis TaxID=2803949 RepID=A0A937F728_9BACT|nr:DUF4494 domain-containing protein [Fulvivirga sediminis]MBL3656221.1 DUF4494 domain-containing protein [Fulvivirga sediminis]
MKTWFACKVKYGRETEEGSLKQVTDAYLMDAVSYTDAETRVHDVIGRELPGEFSVTQISKTNIAEVINYEDSETWFKCKVAYSALDADSEKEKKINTYLLVSADNVKEAYERTEKHFDSMLVPYEIPSITLTNFVEVFPYNGDDIPSNFKPVSEVPDFQYEDDDDSNLEEDGSDIIDKNTGEVISSSLEADHENLEEDDDEVSINTYSEEQEEEEDIESDELEEDEEESNEDTDYEDDNEELEDEELTDEEEDDNLDEDESEEDLDKGQI